MSFSQEVRFKIGGDTTSLKRSFSEAESIAEKAGRAMERSMSKAMSPKGRADQNLSNFYKQQRYEEANAVGKIKIVTQDLARLAQIRERSQQGGVKYLQTQLAIEQKLLNLRRLQSQAQQERASGMPGIPDSPSGGRNRSASGGITGASIFRVVGGIIAAVLERAVAWQQSRISIANAQDSASAVALQSTRGRFAAIGGLQGQLTQGQGSLKDLEGQRDFEVNRKNFLSGGAQGVLSAISPGELQKSEESIIRLNALIQQQHDANALIQRDLERQIALQKTIVGGAEKILIPDAGRHSTVGPDGVRNIGGINIGYRNVNGSIPETERALRGGHLNGLTSAQIELRRAIGAQQVENRLGTSETRRAADLEVRKQQLAVSIATANTLSGKSQTQQTLTEDAAGGRTFRNGQPRPLTESERLARRAGMFRTRARNLILAGSTGSGPGDAINAARADEASVAARLGRASSSVTAPPGTADLSSLKAEIANSNLILKSIDDALHPQSVK